MFASINFNITLQTDASVSSAGECTLKQDSHLSGTFLRRILRLQVTRTGLTVASLNTPQSSSLDRCFLAQQLARFLQYALVLLIPDRRVTSQTYTNHSQQSPMSFMHIRRMPSAKPRNVSPILFGVALFFQMPCLKINELDRMYSDALKHGSETVFPVCCTRFLQLGKVVKEYPMLTQVCREY